jgi:hypothetical protein
VVVVVTGAQDSELEGKTGQSKNIRFGKPSPIIQYILYMPFKFLEFDALVISIVSPTIKGILFAPRAASVLPPLINGLEGSHLDL